MVRNTPRTVIERAAAARHRDVVREFGGDVRRQRTDAGVSQAALARAAGLSRSYICAIEAGERSASIATLASIGAALGGRIVIRLEPGLGVAIRDHLQARMIEALLSDRNPRWHPFLEVPVGRPVRGVIDVVLSERQSSLLIAGEAHSQLRRLEQQLRWHGEKAVLLRESELGRAAHSATGDTPDVSRLLILRSTVATRSLAGAFEATFAAAYPAHPSEAFAALTTGAASWPGAAIVWASIAGRTCRLLDGPPRGVCLGRDRPTRLGNDSHADLSASRHRRFRRSDRATGEMATLLPSRP